MDLAMNGKRALVTGSTSGIGRDIALGLAREGVAVVVHGRDPKRAETVVEAIRTGGGRAATAVGDLTDDDAATAVADAATSAFGGIDILVDNMGGTSAVDGWHDPDPKDWMALYDTNVLSAVRLIGALTPAMRAGGWGRIIQIGSGAHPNPLPQRAAYCAAKAALANLTVSLTKELAGTGITVNTISPGPTDTDGFRATARVFAANNGLDEDIAAATKALLAGPLANPSHRLVQPHEIAAVVALVASPLAASVNGANIRIDGGAIPTVN
jgi:NAD(P)-dependent dehydrogenase (short-subunit alcohol dehydrogenase family)